MVSSIRLRLGGVRAKVEDSRRSRLLSFERARDEYLSRDRWLHAFARGHQIAMFVEAVDWLFGLLSFLDSGSLIDEAKFLCEQSSACKPFLGVRSGAEQLLQLEFNIADVSLHWLATGVVDCDGLLRSRMNFNEIIDGFQPAGFTTAAYVREAGVGAASLLYDRPFVASALLEDWDWIKTNFSSGFESLRSSEKLDGHTFMIVFCAELASMISSPSKESRHHPCDDSRASLEAGVLAWLKSSLAGKPWDRANYYPYLCAQAFEQVCGGVGGGAMAVAHEVRRALGSSR